ncbi:DUF6283 family protein [Streptomyces bobili]|uniref:DUF6283 family protein n=1 Tax=Streptomyces bobili TaxID=67280 RepID=UPI00343E71EE
MSVRQLPPTGAMLPSGIWAHEEHGKLRRDNAPTPQQPSALFRCYPCGANSPGRRICAGWAGCHTGGRLLALRVALLESRIEAETFHAAAQYRSLVPAFGSGNGAAGHGQAHIQLLDDTAAQLISTIIRTRAGLRTRRSTPAPPRQATAPLHRGRSTTASRVVGFPYDQGAGEGRQPS